MTTISRRGLLALSAIALAGGLSGCAPPGMSAVPGYGGGSGNAGGSAAGDPGNDLVLTGLGQILTALSARTGSIAWQYDLGNTATLVGLAFGPNALYTVDDNGHLNAISGDGARLARIGIPGVDADATALLTAGPLYLDNTVFCPSTDGTVRALDPATLRQQSWDYRSIIVSNDDGVGTPSSLAGRSGAVFGCADRQAFAFNSQNGEPLWGWNAASRCGAPLLVGGRLYLVTTNYLVCLDSQRGTEYWGLPGVFSNLATDGTLVYCQRNSYTTCVDPSGNVRWSISTGQQDGGDTSAGPAPTVGGGYLVSYQQNFHTDNATFGSFTGAPCGLDPSSGRIIWSRQDLYFGNAWGAIAGGLYYATVYNTGTRNNGLICLDAATGRTVWFTPLTDRAVGRVYVGPKPG